MIGRTFTILKLKVLKISYSGYSNAQRLLFTSFLVGKKKKKMDPVIGIIFIIFWIEVQKTKYSFKCDRVLQKVNTSKTVK